MSRANLSAVRLVLIVFGLVLGANLSLVAIAGTDIPFYDQWNIEGQWLYPAWIDGTLRLRDIFGSFNEHRIVWTHLLNLGLFVANGQWDPLVQLVVIAVLRAACAALLAWKIGEGLSVKGRIAAGVILTTAFLPYLAWHTVLWGIESHTYFVIGFSWIAFVLLGTEQPSLWRMLTGIAAGVAASFAMAPGELVPAVLLGLIAIRAVERPGEWRVRLRELLPTLSILGLALILHTEGSKDSEWRPADIIQFVVAAGRALAWPHVGTPAASLILNLPIVWGVAARLLRRRRPQFGEDFVLLVGGWSAAIGLAIAWARGGGPEIAVGVPSRYVDFLIGLPLANTWFAIKLLQEAASAWRTRARLLLGCWAAFLLVGWMGLSAEVMTRLILPRARDLQAPVRLARAFQLTGDPAVFAGQPRLFIPHPNLESVRAVLTDPRMQGHLPPSLQPERPMGPLSRAVRWLLRRKESK